MVEGCAKIEDVKWKKSHAKAKFKVNFATKGKFPAKIVRDQCSVRNVIFNQVKSVTHLAITIAAIDLPNGLRPFLNEIPTNRKGVIE